MYPLIRYTEKDTTSILFVLFQIWNLNLINQKTQTEVHCTKKFPYSFKCQGHQKPHTQKKPKELSEIAGD